MFTFTSSSMAKSHLLISCYICDVQHLGIAEVLNARTHPVITTSDATSAPQIQAESVVIELRAPRTRLSQYLKETSVIITSERKYELTWCGWYRVREQASSKAIRKRDYKQLTNLNWTLTSTAFKISSWSPVCSCISARNSRAWTHGSLASGGGGGFSRSTMSMDWESRGTVYGLTNWARRE